MDTLVIDAPAKSSVRAMPNFRRAGAFTKPLDAYFISLTQQIEAGLKPSLKLEEVEDALSSGRVSPDVIDDLEDAMFGAIMVESNDEDNESVSIDEVLEFLRQR